MEEELTRAWSAALLALVALVAPAAPARAHPGHLRLRAERYLKIEVRPDSLRVVFSLQLERMDAFRARQHVDANRDGTLSEAERAGDLRWWSSRLARELTFRLDGAPLTATWGDGAIVPPGEVAPVSTTIELVARAPIEGGGDRRFEVRDAFELDGLARTEVRFAAEGGVTLLRSGVAPLRGLERRLDIAEASATRPRTFVVEARVPGRPADERTLLTVAAGAAAVVLVLGGVATGYFIRRRRAAKAGG